MTVLTTTSKQAAQAMNGSTTTFSFTFRALTDFPEAIKATVLDTTTDTETALTYTAGTPTGDQYSVAIDADGIGGSITVGDARSSDYTITIFREYDLTQESNYADYNAFPSETNEDNHDKSMMVDQQLEEELNRAITLPITVTGVSTELPVPEADRPIGWNSTATALTNYPALIYQVQVDAAATPDYLGATSGDGALRTGGLLNYADGGDFVTISITNADIDHDQLTNFTAAEHFTMLDEDNMVSDSDTQAATQQSIKAYVDAQIVSQNEFVELTDTPANYVGAGTYIVRVNAGATALEFGAEGDIDHDGLTNFVADEHIAHSGVTLTAGAGLSGGGDISASRSFAVDINSEVDTAITALDEILFADQSDSWNIKKDTVQGIIDLAGGGSSTFVGLTDTPANFTGAGLEMVRVNTGETALEYFLISDTAATTVASGDLVMVSDISDSNILKQVTAQSIADLGGGGGATLTQAVAQATHGFSVNDWLYYNGTQYALADASAAGTAESIGIVSAVADVNNFTIQFGGRITGLSGLTAGEAHFLSETAGDITATAPSTEGAVVKPVLIADSTTSGYIFNMRGTEVTSSTSFYQSFTNGTLVSGVLTLTHNLGHKYCQVQIFNNSDKLIMPDDITLVDNDSLTVDLTSYGTLTGTWNAVVLDVGTTDAYANLTFSQSFTNSDLSAGVLAVSHSLSDQYPIIQVYDENDQQVVPDTITATSTSTASVDLGSFGTISGTWRVVVSATGGTAATTPTSTTFNQSFVNGDLSGGSLTVNHNLGTQYNGVTVYDNNGDVIQPDDITATSANVTTIDLTSYGTLTGTWQAVIIGPGAYSSNIASDLNLTGQAAEDFAVFDGTNWVTRGGTEKIVVKNSTRDMTIATGTQAITGVGFRPSYVTFIAGVSGGAAGEASIGIDDGVTDRCLLNIHNVTAENWQPSGQSIYLMQGSGIEYYGSIQSFDVDGFTISWTRVGAKTGTANFSFTCHR